MSNDAGTLYIVATPIGNLGDVSRRALETLAAVDLVAAEDTRRGGRLLSHFGISRPLLSLHEHNEDARVESLLEKLSNGQSVALISDSGTPLISDPGYRLVVAAHRRGLPVTPVPGACSPIAALSVSGLPTDRFVFEGFLPARQRARRTRLEALALETRTMVFLESARRVKATLGDLTRIFGERREACIGRELTKLHESLYRGPLARLVHDLDADSHAERGEYVLMVGGRPDEIGDPGGLQVRELLRVLLDELPPARAAAVAARLGGCSRKTAYEYAIAMGDEGSACETP